MEAKNGFFIIITIGVCKLTYLYSLPVAPACFTDVCLNQGPSHRGLGEIGPRLASHADNKASVHSHFHSVQTSRARAGRNNSLFLTNFTAC